MLRYLLVTMYSVDNGKGLYEITTDLIAPGAVCDPHVALPATCVRVGGGLAGVMRSVNSLNPGDKPAVSVSGRCLR
jgi:hypothetical protein